MGLKKQLIGGKLIVNKGVPKVNFSIKIRNFLTSQYYQLRVDSYKILAHYRDLIDIFSFIYRGLIGYRKPKRILGIINFNDHLFGLGDAIIFQENLCILKEEYHAEQIDVCVIDDVQHVRNKVPDLHWPPQWTGKKFAILQTNLLNPELGNTYFFSRYEDYIHFRIQNSNLYIHYPNRRDQFLCDSRPINKFYQKNRRIPFLSADNDSLDWVARVIDKYIAPAKLIVIQIRNLDTAKVRNSDLGEWEKFINGLDKSRFRIVCICTPEEIVDAWRKIEGVFFSKDLGADFLRDCALIQLSYISLFPASGMAAYARFRGVPFLVFNQPSEYLKKKRSVKFQLSGDFQANQQPIYYTTFQRLLWEKDTAENIEIKFTELVALLDKDEQQKNVSAKKQ